MNSEENTDEAAYITNTKVFKLKNYKFNPTCIDQGGCYNAEARLIERPRKINFVCFCVCIGVGGLSYNNYYNNYSEDTHAPSTV